MTREDISLLAVEAGLPAFIYPELIAEADWKNIELFAKLVAAKEREACAKVCDDVTWEGPFKSAAVAMSNLIRARGSNA